MKKAICILIVFVLTTAVFAGCGPKENAPDNNVATGSNVATESSVATGSKDEAGSKEAKEFTSPVRLESDFVEFCLPEDHDGGTFSDMGANCVITIDRYGNDVVAYHEYDDQGPVEKKTVGEYTFDYQKFNYLNIPNWRMYVIRIVHNYEYYRFIYNVYSSEYDDAQVEKFMKTIRFID
jgi:hypothetical protein